MKAQHTRREQAAKRAGLERGLADGQSIRTLAEQLEVPRSTLQDWHAREISGEVPAALARFCESEEGLEWLHRLVLAAHLVITLLAGAGIRLVCEFLELSGLSAFVASSYGSQHKLNVALEEAVLAYAEQQRKSLAETMPERTISVCEDETYHPEICLVAMEPVSNFILLERYAEDRSAATWTQALAQSLRGLKAEVIQGTSDEAKGLLRHVERDLGAHHSPDLFHIQHEVSKATALPLARATEQARHAQDQAAREVQGHRRARSDYHRRSPRPQGRPPAFEARIVDALIAEGHAREQCEQGEARQQQARAIVRELADAYHPYALDSGQPQSPERLGQRLQACWEQLGELAEQVALPERARARIDKAKRMTSELLATLAFFFATIQAKVEALGLAPEIEAAVHRQLIPAIYLDRVAERSSSAERRQSLRQLSGQLLGALHQSDSPLAQLPQQQRREIETVAAECADLFQRSSSCVEGRNGQLALHHHGKHRLSARKLSALTAMHNYFIRRPDGTTAAERFFGQPAAPMFAFLLRHLDAPPRPARKRPRPPRQAYLLPVQAAA